jgi:hypothetical protein
MKRALLAAAALALPELAFAAFFAGGVLKDTAGNAGPWIVFAATVIGLAIRRLDLESWTLFIPGGLSGRVGGPWRRLRSR